MVALISMKNKLALAAAWLLASAGAWSAGGHHSVDDAALKDAGDCELESWFSRETGNGRLLHAGASCRVGPVELGLGAEYARAGGASQTGWSAEAKWARELVEGFSIGASVQSAWQARARPRYQGVSLVGIATWAPRDDIALHLNIGRDFVHGGGDEKRGGIALEWMPVKSWSFVAERYREQATHFVRAGARHAINDTWTVDASRAHRLTGPAPSTWTVGLTYAFGL
jgi:hypothetical protein